MRHGRRLTARASNATRMRDFFLYLAISVGILAIVLWLAVYEPRVTLSEFHTWFGLAWFTALLAAVLVKMYWKARKRAKLWLLLTSFLAVHGLAFGILLYFVPAWPTVTYILTGSAEVVLFILIAKVTLGVLPITTKV
jgi:hypothetical protein